MMFHSDFDKICSVMKTYDLVIVVALKIFLTNKVTSFNLNDAENIACGVPEQGIGLIVGGEVVEKGDFPWLVALLRRENGKFFCGAVLISKMKVLTAAHCVQNKNDRKALLPRDVVVLLGVYDLDNVHEPGTVAMSPSEILVHPHWNPFILRFDADLALIILESEIILSANVIPICMLSEDEEENSRNKEGVIVGYGQSEDKTKMHETIPRKLTVAIKHNDECLLENYQLAKISSNRTFCAGTTSGMGACRGDSGSGLFIKKGTSYFLKGIVSSSLYDKNGYCDVNNNAVFTNVPKYLKWIQEPFKKESLVEIPKSSFQAMTSKKQTNEPQQCGVIDSPSRLVHDGEKTSRGSFPWTVAIFVREDFDLYELKVVGSLISNRHILSLGNPICVSSEAQIPTPIDVKRLKMYFGIDNLKEALVLGGLVVEGASKILLHPEINLNIPRSADLAIIFLQSPIFISNFISPVCLWDFNKRINGEFVYTSVGWGINKDGVFSESKKYTSITVLDQSVCRKNYPMYHLDEKYICAIGNGMSAPCELDDPLYMKYDERWYLRGLLNIYFFNPDTNRCSVDLPFLFEDIALYFDWVLIAIK